MISSTKKPKKTLSPKARARVERIAKDKGVSVPKPGEKVEFKPQEGPQTEFLESEADITIYGGGAGGGKTFGLLLDPLKDTENPGFGTVIFRRTMKQVKDEGGIWDQSENIYPLLGARSNLTERYWSFPSGATVQFAGLEHEKDKYDWQGAEICDLEFDELTHFTEGQFFYLLSRNRSTCGVRPRCRATTNPGPGWVKRLLAPWVDKKFPNPARSGEVRWFKRENNQIVWLDGKPERKKCGCLAPNCEDCFPPEKSITFIRASVYDNKILLEKNPEYLTNLQLQDEVEKRRLLYGDWDAKPAHMVLDGFDSARHVVPWRDVSAWKYKAVGADFGSINTASVVIAEEPETKQLYVIGEDWPGVSRTFEDIADAIREMAGGTPVTGAGGNRTTEQGWRQAMRQEGIPMEEPDPKHTDPALQYQCVNDLLKSGDLFIFDTCVKTIAMIESFTRILDDEGQPTDKFDDTKFHLLAALRYIVTKLRPPKQPIAEWATY